MSTDPLSKQRAFLEFVTKTPAAGVDVESRLALVVSRFHALRGKVSQADYDAIASSIEKAEGLLGNEKTRSKAPAAVTLAEKLIDRARQAPSKNTGILPSEMRALRSSVMKEAADVSALAIEVIKRAERLGDAGLVTIVKARGARADLVTALNAVKSATEPATIEKARKIVASAGKRVEAAEVAVEKAESAGRT